MVPVGAETQERISQMRAHPDVTNTVWAIRWGVSRERARQIREKAGLAPLDRRRRFTTDVANEVLALVRWGYIYRVIEHKLELPVGTISRWQQRDPVFAMRLKQVRDARLALEMVGPKQCSECGRNKSRDEFYLDSGTRDGLSYRCIECAKERAARYARERDDVLEPVAEKRCPRCEVTKPAIEFYRNKRSHDGLVTYCKACERDRGRRSR